MSVAVLPVYGVALLPESNCLTASPCAVKGAEAFDSFVSFRLNASRRISSMMGLISERERDASQSAFRAVVAQQMFQRTEHDTTPQDKSERLT